MKHLKMIPFFVVNALWSFSAFADVTCAEPMQAANGGSWDVFCSDDGSRNTDYSCSVNLSVNTKNDEVGAQLPLNVFVAQNQKNVPLQIPSLLDGSNITSISIDSVKCDAQE